MIPVDQHFFLACLQAYPNAKRDCLHRPHVETIYTWSDGRHVIGETTIVYQYTGPATRHYAVSAAAHSLMRVRIAAHHP
jgi:hypothetical protein